MVDETEYTKQVYEKQKKLHLFSKLRAEGCSEKIALEAIEISRATYYRWRKSYKKHGLSGLENKSRRPNNIRKPLWDKNLEIYVRKIRKQFPLWGKYKIEVLLEREYGLRVSASTVGRILSELFRKGIIKKSYFFYGRVKEKRRRIFSGHAQRWCYGMKARHPGELIQIDHCSVELGDGEIIKHFKAVCPITKLSVEQAYKRATASVAADFLQSIRKQFPFVVCSIQVDGGSEFMGEFEEACKKLAIELFVLPPKSPKYNAHVERGNSTVKYEFYWQYAGPSNLDAIRYQLQKFVKFYNEYRPHQALHYLTPWQYYLTLEAK